LFFIQSKTACINYLIEGAKYDMIILRKFERRNIMEKLNTYMINKVFTVPYIDKMVDENSVPDSFLKCI